MLGDHYDANGGGGGSASKPKPPHSSHTHHPTASSSTDSAEDCRPFHKVILLCGPPGTGKVSDQ